MDKIVRGQTVAINCQAILEDEVLDISLVTNIQFSMKVNATDSYVDAVLSKSLGAGITITNTKQGLFTVLITANETMNLPASNVFHYEVGLRFGASNRDWIRTGICPLEVVGNVMADASLFL